MGESTDAILFYGYHWGEDEKPLREKRDDDDEEGNDDDELDWVDEIMKKRGVESPWDNYPKGTDNLPWQEREALGKKWRAENRGALDAWAEAKLAVRKEFGVELCAHCSSEYPMYYLATAKHTSCRGYTTEIKDLRIDPAWADGMDRWFKEMGVKKPQPEPKWWLVSYWG